MKNISPILLALFYILLINFQQLQAQSSVFESEPNDAFGTANALAIGDTMRGAISTNTDNDFYVINVPTAGVLDISVTNVQSPVDIRVYIYDANYGLVDVQGSANSNGNPLFFRKLACAPGAYYFKVQDYDQNQSAPGLYKFSVQLDLSDVYECNNTFQTAFPIAIGDTIRAAINDIGDWDYFKVNIPRAGVFDVSITNVQSPIDIGVYLYDANYAVKAYNGSGNSNGSPMFFRKQVCVPGDYYFKIEDYDDNESARGLYQFVVQLDTTDVYECNNTFQTASPIALGDTIRAAINSIGDWDYFKVTIPRAGVFDVSVTNVESPIDIGAYLYDANNSVLDYHGSGNTNGSPLFFKNQICLPGDYYFRVEDYDDNESARGLYKFVVQLDTTDSYECNNTFQDAMPIDLCDTVVGTFSFNEDKDYYLFNAQGNQTLSFTLTNIPVNVNPRLRIYDAFQNEIYNRLRNPGQPLQDSIAIPSTGQYFLLINDDGYNASAVLPYQLLLKQACITTGNETVPAPFVSLFPNPANDALRLVLSTTSMSGYDLRIVDAFGKVIWREALKERDCILDTKGLPSGVYLIQIQSENWVTTKRIAIQH